MCLERKDFRKVGGRKTLKHHVVNAWPCIRCDSPAAYVHTMITSTYTLNPTIVFDMATNTFWNN